MLKLLMISYVVTAFIFILIQLAIRSSKKIDGENLYLTLVCPFWGFPKFQYEDLQKKSRKIIYKNLAFVNFVYTAVFLLALLVSMNQGNDTPLDNNDPISIILDIGWGIFTLFEKIVTFLVAVIVGLIITMIPLLIASNTED